MIAPRRQIRGLLALLAAITTFSVMLITISPATASAQEVVYEYSYDYDKQHDLGVAGDYDYVYTYTYQLILDENGQYQTIIDYGYDLEVGDLEKSYDYALDKGNIPDVNPLCPDADGYNKGYNLDLTKGYDLSKGDLEKGYDYDLSKGYDFSKGGPDCEAALCAAGAGGLLDGLFDGVSKGYDLDISKGYDLSKGDLDKGYDYDLSKGYDYAKGDYANVDIAALLTTCNIDICTTPGALGILIDLYNGPVEGVNKGYDLDLNKGYDLSKGDLDKGYDLDLSKGYDFSKGDLGGLDAEVLGILSGCNGLINPCDSAAPVGSGVPTCEVEVCAVDGSYAVSGGLFGDLLAGLFDGAFSGVSKGYDLDLNKGYDLSKGDLDKGYDLDLNKGYGFAKGDYANLDLDGLLGVFDLTAVDFNVDNCQVDVCSADGAFSLAGGLLGGLVDGVSKGYDLDLNKGYDLSKGDLDKGYDLDLAKGYDFSKGDIVNVGALVDLFDLGEATYSIDDCQVDVCATDGAFVVDGGLLGGLVDGVNKGYDLDLSKGYDLSKGDLDKGYDLDLSKGYDFSKGEALGGLKNLFDFDAIDFDLGNCSIDNCADTPVQVVGGGLFDGINKGYDLDLAKGYDLSKGDLDKGYDFDLAKGYDFSKGQFQWNFSCTAVGDASIVDKFDNPIVDKFENIFTGLGGIFSLNYGGLAFGGFGVPQDFDIAGNAPYRMGVADGEGFAVGDAGVTVSCLAGNGRVDTNIVNRGAATATYVVEFGTLSGRQRVIQPGDWGRVAITGRPDGDHTMRVLRDGQVIADTTVTIACDADVAVGASELSVVNSCRAGLGFIMFQFVNETDQARPYVIEFDTVANRSTQAQAHGAAVRSVTGRPDGDYGYLVRTGGTVLHEGVVTVDC